jgi:hypothetical protein
MFTIIKRLIFLIATIALLTTIGCNGRQTNSAQVKQTQNEEQTQEAQTQYYHWADELATVEIEYVRKGDAFYGFYFCGVEGTLMMGMIDKEGNLTGISAVASSGEIDGKLSGKITGDKLSASWSPSPSGMEFYDFQQVEMTLQKEFTPDIKEYLAEYNFLPETPYTPLAYGYHTGEWENRHISIGKNENGKTEFSLHIEEGGMNDINLTITGTVTLNGNTFRHKEKNCEFEVSVYNGFITVKTISGALDGFQVDGVYPAPNLEQ